MDRNRVPVLELEIGGFVAGALDLGAAVGGEAGGEASDLGGYIEYVGDGFWVDESVGDFFLGYDDAGVGAADGDSGEAGCGGGGFECVFHLVESALGGEDCDVVVIVGVATHCVRLFI